VHQGKPAKQDAKQGNRKGIDSNKLKKEVVNRTKKQENPFRNNLKQERISWLWKMIAY